MRADTTILLLVASIDEADGHVSERGQTSRIGSNEIGPSRRYRPNLYVHIIGIVSIVV